jgi:hypothetical protein
LDDGFIKIKKKKNIYKRPKVKIEGFSSKVIVQNDSKIDYKAELRLNHFWIYGANKPSLFYKINNSRISLPLKKDRLY